MATARPRTHWAIAARRVAGVRDVDQIFGGLATNLAQHRQTAHVRIEHADGSVDSGLGARDLGLGVGAWDSERESGAGIRSCGDSAHCCSSRSDFSVSRSSSSSATS